MWEDVLHALREEVSDELTLLRWRLERIEHLLDEGLPPDQEHLPDPPDKVNRYLEQNLPQASLVVWHNDSRIYNSIQALIEARPRRAGDDRFAAGGEDAFTSPGLTGQPLMVPSTISLDGFSSSDEREDTSFTTGEGEILQLLRSPRHLKEIEEDSD